MKKTSQILLIFLLLGILLHGCVLTSNPNKATKLSTMMERTISLDSLIIQKDMNLIHNYDLNSKNLNKKGLNYTVKYYNRSDSRNLYTLFDMPVENIEALIVNNKLIMLGINIDDDNNTLINQYIEKMEKTLLSHLGSYNSTYSVKQGSRRRLAFGGKNNYIVLDAFFSTDINDGHLSVAFITEEYRK